MEKVIKRAKQKYEESKRNYNHFKDLYEEYYNSSTSRLSNGEIKEITIKMNHEFDKIQEMNYIFGRKYINEIIGE